MFLTTTGSMSILGNIIYPLAWMMTSIGFLMILYSRLHLILDRPRVLHAIAFTILGIGIPIQIIMVLAGDRVLNDKVWVVTFRLEVIFPVADILLAVLYIYLFIRFMRQAVSSVDAHTRRTFLLLVLSEAAVVVLDVAGITLWYVELYLLRLALLPFIYAVKLKVEFAVLNRLAGVGKKRARLNSVESREEVQVVQGASPRIFDHGHDLGMGGAAGDGVGVRSPADNGKDVKARVEGSEKTGGGDGDSGGKESFDDLDRQYLGSFKV
jgi:hypothetical protein